jgi:hypothetical protein
MKTYQYIYVFRIGSSLFQSVTYAVVHDSFTFFSRSFSRAISRGTCDDDGDNNDDDDDDDDNDDDNNDDDNNDNDNDDNDDDDNDDDDDGDNKNNDDVDDDVYLKR